MVPVVSIVGKSDSGKTTLIEKLIPELKRRGYRIGTIKHDAHRFEMDHEGKDTYRHFHAGADTVVISSAEKVAMQRRVERQLTIDELVAQFLNDVDIVLTEGYKSADKPKIEVFRSAAHSAPLCTDRDNRIALASDVEVAVNVPRFHIDDVAGIADFIETTFLKK
ncbi:MAG: molybdopterin-guanine dinucleotide biosynthesis protein B [Planctomycetota bacterium]